MCVCVYLCHASWPNEKRYRPEIWHTYSHWPYLKTSFSKKIPVTAVSLEKMPCHADFPQISSIALFFVVSKKWPWGPLASKNCRARGFSTYLSDCLVIFQMQVGDSHTNMLNCLLSNLDLKHGYPHRGGGELSVPKVCGVRWAPLYLLKLLGQT